MNLQLTIAQTLGLTNLFLVIYVVIDSSEKLYWFKEYQPNGILNWDLLQKNEFINSRPALLKKILRIIFPARAWMLLLAMRIMCGFGLIVFLSSDVALACFYIVLFVIGALLNLRNIAYGAETDNRFSLIIIGALMLRSFVPTLTVTLVCFWFIALQTCLSYVTAGAAKLVNTNWRTGNGFRLVATTSDRIHLTGVNAFFEKRKVVAIVINWLIIVFECIFPLLLIVPRGLFWCFLIGGIFFHLAVAFFLRLGKFFWVWVAAYPALIFITQR